MTISRASVLALLACSLLGGWVACSSAPEPASVPPGIQWLRNSTEYRAGALQAYRLATERIEERASTREPGSWAVSLDLDQTVFNTSDYDYQNALAGRSYSRPSFSEWCRLRRSRAVPGVGAFLARVRELGGRIAMVSNRSAEVLEATEDNLRSLGLPFDVILLFAEQREKEPRWEALEQGTTPAGLPPLEVVMWIGDNVNDFPGVDQSLRLQSDEAFEDFGSRFIVLPNPMYGSWARNPEE